jgi:hypothetical protein
MGISIRRLRHGPDSNITYSYCFEELCTRSMTRGPHGTFFSIIHRKIGDLNVIMAGEVDCSESMHLDQSIGDSMLIPTLEEEKAEPYLGDYIELKTFSASAMTKNRYSEWYMQSYLLGVNGLALGERKSSDRVSAIKRMAIEEVLRDAQNQKPGFDPVVKLGRAHAILSALLKYFRSLGQSISAEDEFNIRVYAEGNARVTRVLS